MLRITKKEENRNKVFVGLYIMIKLSIRITINGWKSIPNIELLFRLLTENIILVIPGTSICSFPKQTEFSSFVHVPLRYETALQDLQQHHSFTAYTH